MSDGNIRIDISVDGKEVDVASDSLRGLEDSAKGAGEGAKDTNTGIREIVTSLGLVKIGAAAFRVLSGAMDSAIARFDTFNQFPRVMEGLGVSTDESSAAIDRLSDGIDGLPTLLDEITMTAQRMYTSFEDMDKATDSALALNNALLASGSSGEQAKRGTEQYIKALQTGKMEMDTWQTLQQTMNVGLVKIAEAFGMTEQELYSALQSGMITMDEFNDKMIELGTGSGELTQLARDNSEGIATALSNLRNTASRGLADIMDSFNKLSEAVTGNSIAQNIEGLKGVINSAFDAIGSAIEASIPYVIAFVDGVKAAIPVVESLTPLLSGLLAVYLQYQAIQKWNDLQTRMKGIFEANSVAIAKLTAMTKAKTTAEIASSTTTATYTTATLASTSALTAKNIILGLLTGQLKLSTAATLLKAKAVGVLSGALKLLTGPVGWVIAGIGALTAGAVALVKWFNRSSEEADRLNAEQEELAESTDQLTDSVDSTSKAYEDQQQTAEASAQTNRDMANEVENLMDKENKSAAEKQLLKDRIDELNESVDGLSLAYNEETDAMNMSSEELQARLDLMEEQVSYNDALERQTEIMQEQNETQMQLEEVNELRDEWNQKLEEGEVKAGEHREAIAGLDEQEQALKTTLSELGEQHDLTEEQVNNAMASITEATENGVGAQIQSYEDLDEATQATFDSMEDRYTSLKDAATDAFQTINDESELTMEEMLANQEHNMAMTEAWGDNMADLYGWAAENGHTEFMHWLDNLTIDNAAELQELADATDSELETFANNMGDGAETGADAFKTSMGEGMEESVDAVIGYVDDHATTMRQDIEAADFGEIGKMIPEGTKQGIEDGADDAIDAAGNMADDMTKKTKQTLKINSPSGVFKDIGTNTTDGITLGVNKGTSKVLNAVTQVATQMPRPFDTIGNIFRNIGSNAMGGLEAGLIGRRGRVLSIARGIANSIASTMQRALRIQSPSKVMEQEVGRFIPEGLAEGIEGHSGTVLDAIHGMNNQMMKIATPEAALGAHNMTGSSVSNISKSTNSHYHDNRKFDFNANANGTEGNDREFYQRMFREFKWMMQNEGGAFNG